MSHRIIEMVNGRPRSRLVSAEELKAQGLTYRKGPNGKWGWYPRPTNQDKERSSL